MPRIFGFTESFRPTYARISDQDDDQGNEQIPPDYTEIELQYLEHTNEKHCPTCAHQITRRSFSDSWWPWIAHTILLCTSATLLCLSLRVSSTRDVRWEETRVFSPANEAVEYHRTVFNGSFDFPSIYRGVPTQDIDHAWNQVSRDVGFIRVSENDLERMGYGSTSRSYMARYREEDGGGYLATVEVFHQLHCLNLLRKVTYREYYEKTDPSFQHQPEFFRTHLGVSRPVLSFRKINGLTEVTSVDHCVEFLRQALMCSADVAIITYDWVEGHEEPYPDFNTKHQCRNFESVLKWGREHLVNVPVSQLGRIGDEVDLMEVP